MGGEFSIAAQKPAKPAVSRFKEFFHRFKLLGTRSETNSVDAIYQIHYSVERLYGKDAAGGYPVEMARGSLAEIREAFIQTALLNKSFIFKVDDFEFKEDGKTARLVLDVYLRSPEDTENKILARTVLEFTRHAVLRCHNYGSCSIDANGKFSYWESSHSDHYDQTGIAAHLIKMVENMRNLKLTENPRDDAYRSLSGYDSGEFLRAAWHKL